MNHSRARSLLVVGVLAAAACSGSSDDGVEDTVAPIATRAEAHTIEADPPATGLAVTDPSSTEPPATDPSTTSPAATETPAIDLPATDPSAQEDPAAEPDPITNPAELVSLLASDDFNGRDNQTEGSAAARDLLVSLLRQVAAPAVPDETGGLGFLHEYNAGTNIVGVVPGSGELANEYVMVGAHYDHLAPGECDARDEDEDVICNGAADNAAGVASVMTIVGRRHAQADRGADDSGRRGLIVAFWDGEEDGLVGSRRYVDDPVIPLGQTVAYINFDIQGASMLPAMSNNTVLVGPETGGPVLVDAAARATDASTLDYATLSLVFGQRRSDHAVLVDAGVPSLFFSDGNNGCYHTVLDDIDHYEADKHLLQIAAAESVVDDLLASPERPEIVTDAPLSTFADAKQLLTLVKSGGSDLVRLPNDVVAATAFLEALNDVVGAGPEAYDDAAAAIVFSGAAQLLGGLADSECLIP